MNQPKAFGAFIKRGDYTFRTSAYIQWGESKKSIGSCLLLNPGSAKLDDHLIHLLEKDGAGIGFIKIADPTMKQLIKLVEGIYGPETLINGRFHIYNLFNLQNTDSNHAIDQFEYLVECGEYDITESLISLKELQAHPWILLGWGVSLKPSWKNLERIKKSWRNLISESRVPSFGKKHKKTDDYYHPCPLIPTHQSPLLSELITLYKKKSIMIKPESESQEIKKRYTLLKWNGEYGAEAKFIVKDNWTAKQSLFTPGRCEDLFWFHANLANDNAVSTWEEFGEESFDDLEPIAF